MLRRALIPLAAVITLCGMMDAGTASERTGWTECGPPADTFYYQVRIYHTTCRTAQRVLTHGKCTNLPRCSRLRYRSWRCHVGSSISDRATVCRNGERRIIAKASGD